MQSPPILTNAWFEKMFDTLAWDIIARGIFIVTYGVILYLALSSLWYAWTGPESDALTWVIITRILAVINISIPILLVIVRRRPIKRIHGMTQRVIALGGTFLSSFFIVVPIHEVGLVALAASMALLVVGGCLTAWTWFFLGRSFSLMAEARKLQTTGPYRIVRHPLYLFEEMSVVAVYLQNPTIVNTIILAVQMACQLQRMRYEERILEEAFPEYREFRMKRARIIPGIY